MSFGSQKPRVIVSKEGKTSNSKMVTWAKRPEYVTALFKIQGNHIPPAGRGQTSSNSTQRAGSWHSEIRPLVTSLGLDAKHRFANINIDADNTGAHLLTEVTSGRSPCLDSVGKSMVNLVIQVIVGKQQKHVRMSYEHNRRNVPPRSDYVSQSY